MKDLLAEMTEARHYNGMTQDIETSPLPSIVLASDHGGYELKEALKGVLLSMGCRIEDLGADSTAAVDYPDYAQKLAAFMLAGKAERGILICGTGVGMSIAANRVKGIRAALCHDVTGARLARQHNDANVLCLGARVTGLITAMDIVTTFIDVPFEGGRHQRRVDKLG